MVHHQPVMSDVIRRPAVAGYFYPAEAGLLGQTVDALTRMRAQPAPARAVVVPHGSYRHSGAIAGATFARVVIPRRCVILGPSHTGRGASSSLMAGGAYRTQLGEVPVDASCADALLSRCPFLEVDARSQRGEHAIEVQLPFLQRLGPPDLTVVPIITGAENLEAAARLGEALVQVIRMQEEPVLLIASADLSHYASAAHVAAQDRPLLDAIQRLDGAALIQRIREEGMLVCGGSAIACVLEAAGRLGARSAALVQYGTSADAGGDPHSAIGYAGCVVL